MKRIRHFGWRYFHFIDSTGVRINTVVHETDIFGLEQTPYMSMMIKDQSHRLPIRFKGPVRCNWNPDNIRSRFEFVFEDGKFSGLIGQVKEHRELTEVVLFQDSLSGRNSKWSVDVPHAKFNGKIEDHDKERIVSGYVYQDRQWGDLLLQEWVSDWVWGHFATDKSFVIFFKILTIGGDIVSHALLNLNDLVYVEPNFEALYLHDLRKSKKPAHQITEGIVDFKLPNIALRAQLLPENLMRSRVNEDYGEFNASYLRWLCMGTLGNQQLGGIAEYMRIR